MGDTLNRLGNKARGFLQRHILKKGPKSKPNKNTVDTGPTLNPVDVVLPNVLEALQTGVSTPPPNRPPPEPPQQQAPQQLQQQPEQPPTVAQDQPPPQQPTEPEGQPQPTNTQSTPPPNRPPPEPPQLQHTNTAPNGDQPPPDPTAPDPTAPDPTAPTTQTQPVVVSEDQNTYEAEREGMALDETAVMRIGDIPDDQKLLREAYSASALKTKVLVDKGDFAGAFASLTQLKLDVKAALDARRKAMVADTKLKCAAINTKLDKVESNKKKVWQNTGGDRWKSAVDDILAVQLDQDFTDRYDAINKKVGESIAADPIVQKGFAKWAEWTKDPKALKKNKAAMEEVMNKVLEIQSKLLGLDPATPASTYSKPHKPGDCGGFDTKSKSISINSGASSFPDFKELLDTLTHENTHAYQTKLINGYRDGTLPESDPNYNAAVILSMNDGKGYVTPDESDLYPGKDAYNKQVCEVHAWRAGAMAGQAAYKAMKKAAKKGNK
jgi:hypothetical protein